MCYSRMFQSHENPRNGLESEIKHISLWQNPWYNMSVARTFMVQILLGFSYHPRVGIF